MAEFNAQDFSGPRRDARLSRRSLVAAGTLLAAMGPVAASKVFAQSNGNPNQGNIPGCAPSGAQPPKCLCFLSGTRLLTPDGEAEIDALRIGDIVATSAGASRAIRWIGRIAFSRAEGWHEDVLPVRIAKGALGPEAPHRDLYVSRAHMLFLDGVLIPVSNLINGSTISVVAPDVEALHYFHVELGSHDIVLAEGAPCESLLAEPEKLVVFDNADEYYALYGHLPRMKLEPYAPIASFNGGRGEFKSRMRSVLAPVIDIRRPLDIVRDSVEARALMSRAA